MVDAAPHEHGKARRPTRYVGLSMKERVAARRRDFTEAGIELLGTRGVAASKVSDICRHAGLTERYFYESFSSVEEFVHVVAETVAIRAGSRMLTAALSEEDVREQGHAMIREALALVEEDPRVGRILLVETLRAGGSLSEMRTTTLTAAASLLRLALDPSPETDLQEVIAGVAHALMFGHPLPSELTTSPDPVVLALGGAVSEVLMGWSENRIDMSQSEVRDFLEAMFDATLHASVEPVEVGKLVGGAVTGNGTSP